MLILLNNEPGAKKLVGKVGEESGTSSGRAKSYFPYRVFNKKIC
jgi:hypothetical protein